MNRTFVALLAAASLLVTTSCSSDSASTTPVAAIAGEKTAAPTIHEHEHVGGHTYACPMHPEETSTVPGQKCPKCGMEEVHNDHVANGKTYQMKLAANPAQPVAGQPTTFTFTPQEVGNEQSLVPLDVVHEKKMHFIVVRKDLSVFYHEHPEFKADGTYQVAHTFDKGGDYVLFEDYTPSGSGHQLGRQPVAVQGPTYTPVKFRQDKMQWQEAGYQATLAFDKDLRAQQLLGLKITISQHGQPVTDLENYLGALGHVVVISEDTEHYLHVHPNDQADKGPAIGFNTNFDMPGLYRVFLQFNHGGQIHTADFTINVKD